MTSESKRKQFLGPYLTNQWEKDVALFMNPNPKYLHNSGKWFALFNWRGYEDLWEKI